MSHTKENSWQSAISPVLVLGVITLLFTAYDG